MLGWENMMPPGAIGYDLKNWASMPIKSEPMDLQYSMDHKARNGLNECESSPTSQQSMDSLDSAQQQAMFYPEQMMTQGQIPANHLHRPLGFNPLTPPGYPNAVIPIGNLLHHHQHHLQHQNGRTTSDTPQAIIPTTPYRHTTKTETSLSVNGGLTPSHTPPIDDTPPKSPKYHHNNNETPEKAVSETMSNSGDESRSMDSGNEDDDIRTPKVNSHGKVKTFKCKQCDFVAVTKKSFWEHTREHIKPEKMLKCLKCPFVTEYKHHLEYHLRNHDGSKPFQCSKCTYTCVNKSMLNSHLKSHSNVYQYRCCDCNYAAKYCHSLKLHLRKYDHKPAVVLNQDGSPNPLPIIDVYGTRRGPKTRNTKANQETSAAAAVAAAHQSTNGVKELQLALQQQQQLQQQQLQQQNEQLHQQQQQHQQHHQLQQHQQHQQQQQQQLQQMQGLNIPQLMPNAFSNMFPYLNLNLQMFAAQRHQVLAQLSPNTTAANTTNLEYRNDHQTMDSEESNDNDQRSSFEFQRNTSNTTDGLDLTITGSPQTPLRCRQYTDMGDEKITTSTIHPAEHVKPSASRSSPLTTPSVSKNRRKGRAFKLEMMTDVDQENDDDEIENRSNSTANDTTVAPIDAPAIAPQATAAIRQLPTSSKEDEAQSTPSTHCFECKYCGIAFKDDVLHTIHMGYHGFNDVFKCNMCGVKCSDPVSFFLHIARISHS